LNIRTADFEHVQIVDLPMTAHPAAIEENLELGTEPHEFPSAECRTAPADEMESMAAYPPAATTAPAASDASATGSNPQGPNVSETQRIVTVRVSAVGDTRWTGSQLMAALENHGLAYGRYQVFHRRHSDGRTLFCAASLVEPGTFDLARMPEEQFRGLTLFAVLPGPAEPLQTLDALIQTAGELAETLRGVVQDSKGVPLSQQRAEALREDVARFQAMLTMS
jgi:cell division protein ZipA